jgi:hypothetical protein
MPVSTFTAIGSVASLERQLWRVRAEIAATARRRSRLTTALRAADLDGLKSWDSAFALVVREWQSQREQLG